MKEWNGEGPLPTLYSKTATDAVNVWICWVVGDTVCVSWGQLNGAMQEARFICKPKNVGRSNATTAYQQAVSEAKAKWVKQKKKKYSESLETAGETQRIKPMLALDFEGHGHKIVYPAYAQPKFDGVRCLAYRKDGQVYLQSRGGDPYLLPHIQHEVGIGMQSNYSDFIFDGELYLHGVSLQTITSLAKRPRPESEQLFYCIYDCFCSRLGSAYYEERAGWLATWFTNYARFFKKVWEVPTLLVKSADGVVQHQKQFVADGYEGAIIRSREGAYREGYRSPDLLKVKTWQDAEFAIVSYTVGKGKFENVPIFKCVTNEGKDFDVAPKGTNEERAELLRQAPSLIGKLMKVKFFQWTDENKPQFPVGLGIRDRSDLS